MMAGTSQDNPQPAAGAAPVASETVEHPTSATVAPVKGRAGRKPGSKNRRTVEVEIVLRPLLPKARKTIAALMQSKNEEIAFKAAALIHAYIYGKPTERREISGADGGPLVWQSVNYANSTAT